MRKNLIEKKKRRLHCTAALLAAVLLSAVPVYALAEEVGTETVEPELQNETAQKTEAINSRYSEEGVYVYLRGGEDDLTVKTAQLGNTICPSVTSGPISELGLPIRTVIMLDNSISLGNRFGEKAIRLMEQLVDAHEEGEQFRVATFSESVTELSPYTSDYVSVKSYIEAISFEDQDTYLSEMLHDFLMDSQDGNAAYTRFIIIADGADDNEISYTEAELKELMKEAGVVIHTVGVKTSNNAELLERLFSYSRSTGGSYTVADADAEPEMIVDTIDQDYLLHYAKLMPDVRDMDGSRKEAKLTILSDGKEETVHISVQVPFGTGEVIEAESEEETEKADEEKASEAKPEIPVINVNQGKDREDAQPSPIPMLLYIVIATAAGATVIVVILLAVRKKNAGPRVIMPDTRSESNETVLINSSRYVKLTDINNPERQFSARLDESVIIGRESGDIRISDDETVSSKHCEIIRKGQLFYLNDLGSSNGTYYQGSRIYSQTPILDGSVLGCGEYKYLLELR